MKKFGVLCPISSLPSKYGVGDFGAVAREFVDSLRKNNVQLWQFLPLSKTNKYNCPYASISAYTFDEMYVDLDDLVSLGLLQKSELKSLTEFSKTEKVSFDPVKKMKLELFEKAYSRAGKETISRTKKYAKLHTTVENYAYFMSLLEFFNKTDWREIDKKFWKKDSKDGQAFMRENERLITKYEFFQYILSSEWKRLRDYANKNKVSMVGDVPIYCAPESLEVFLNPECYMLDKNYNPTVTGGCPPDYFSSTGQDWGTCIYNWDYIKRGGYEYILNRLTSSFKFYDYMRIDHFIGLVEHYENSKVPSIKSGWRRGGGEELFALVQKRMDIKKIFVEDLGLMSDECIRVRDLFNLRGLSILQFAFDNENNPFLPQNVRKNTIYYLGNHDNNTFIGFLQSQSREGLEKIKKLLKSNAKTIKELHFDAIKSLLKSRAEIVILTVQDILLQDGRYVMNVPGRAEDCWNYKVPASYKKKFDENMLLISAFR